MLNTPILLIVFNRPDKTKIILEQIEKAKPAFLYIAADGPRAEISDDIKNCAEVKKIIESIDWNCQIKTLFRENNLGCKEAVSSAINWFFSNVSEGIILEDDIFPDQSFFFFCEVLLEKYRNDNSIMLINGSNFHYKEPHNAHSYYFSRYPLIWGWATWRRAWQCYDKDMRGWPERRDRRWLNDVFDGDKKAVAFWTRNFRKVHKGKINTWDYQWVFSIWAQNGLSIHPHRNLIRNIGFGKDATHTTQADGVFSNLKIEDGIQFPLSHPPSVVRNTHADDYMENFAYSRRKKRKKVSNQLNLKKILRQIRGKR